MSDSISAYEDNLVEQKERNRHLKMSLEEVIRRKKHKEARLQREKENLQEQTIATDLKWRNVTKEIEALEKSLAIVEGEL